MNIALFSDSYTPTKSGIVTVVTQLKKILESLGHHVVVVTVSAKDKEYIEDDDDNVMRVTSITSPFGDGQFLGIPHKKSIIKFLERHNIELIHAHTEFFMGHAAIKVGKAMKIPVIASTHTLWEEYYRHYFALGALIPRNLIRKVVKRLYKKFYSFINVSQKAQDYFKMPFMLPKTPCAIIPNAIDLDKFSGTEVTASGVNKLKKSLGIGKKDRVILYVGRVVEEKRVIELLEIISKVLTLRKNVKMVFVGAGGALEDLQKTVAKQKLEKNVLFTGFIDWQKLPLYYSIGDIFVTASLSEMHSMTILEAVSLGLPTVCRKDSSFADTIFHGVNGYFADSDEEMVDHIVDLVDNADKAKMMGKAAREISENFVLEIHGKRTVAYYKKVLEVFPKKVSSAALQNAVDSVKKV